MGVGGQLKRLRLVYDKDTNTMHLFRVKGAKKDKYKRGRLLAKVKLDVGVPW